jgi:hypothetical protein
MTGKFPLLLLYIKSAASLNCIKLNFRTVPHKAETEVALWATARNEETIFDKFT